MENYNQPAHVYQRYLFKQVVSNDPVILSFMQDHDGKVDSELLDKIYSIYNTNKNKKVLIELGKGVFKGVMINLKKHICESKSNDKKVSNKIVEVVKPIFQFLEPENINITLTDDENFALITNTIKSNKTGETQNVYFLIATNMLMSMVTSNIKNLMDSQTKDKEVVSNEIISNLYNNLMNHNKTIDSELPETKNNYDKSDVFDFTNGKRPREDENINEDDEEDNNSKDYYEDTTKDKNDETFQQENNNDECSKVIYSPTKKIRIEDESNSVVNNTISLNIDSINVNNIASEDNQTSKVEHMSIPLNLQPILPNINNNTNEVNINDKHTSNEISKKIKELKEEQKITTQPNKECETKAFNINDIFEDDDQESLDSEIEDGDSDEPSEPEETKKEEISTVQNINKNTKIKQMLDEFTSNAKNRKITKIKSSIGGKVLSYE
ncbi:hypothetical protein CsNV_089 [Callinectes sapidus nudivirus]|nr:hypothetical protein CsNV_089 [Callinectes sapidus nudivirus]